LNLNIDVSAAFAPVADEMADGEGNAEGGEGQNDYVGADYRANYLSNPKPKYPLQSRRLREQGLVKLRVHITAQGRAGEVVLHASSGFERLDREAIDAVKRWKFRPAQRAGTPVASWETVPLEFKLDD
jgi:protein TonB